MYKFLKKFAPICLMLLFSSLIFVGFKVNNKDINMIHVHTDQAYYVDDLQGLESKSDLIIKAKVLPNSINKTFESPSGLVYYGITYTDIEVTNVFFGNVKIGDKLKITEEYYYIDDFTTRSIYHTENYGPSTSVNEYIFFSKEYPDSKTEFIGMYYPLGVEKGRYPIFEQQNSLLKGRSARKIVELVIDEMTNEELNLGEEDSTEYREILNDVLNKYK